MQFGFQALLAGIAAIVLVLLATVESAYEQTSEVSLHILRGEARDRREAFFGELMQRRQRFLMSLKLGIQVATLAIALVAADVAFALGTTRAALAAFGASLVAVFLLHTFVPRLVAGANPQRLLIGLMPFFKPYYRLTSHLVAPFDAAISGRAAVIEPPAPEAADDDPDTTMSDIQAFIGMGAEEGIIEESEGLMIQSIVEFGDRVVEEVMTARNLMVALSATATLLEARDLMVASKHSRLPVYNGDVDNVEGVLYVRDLIAAWQEGRENEPVTSAMRPVYFVPEVKPVADLLEEMRKSNVQIALVIDEYGSVAGVVTIEDLLEEIVGEIEDEDVDESETGEIVVDEDGSVLVKGSTEIRKIETHFGVELEADDFTTVAGLIIGELGRVPSPGEDMVLNGIEFNVVEADDRKINMVRLRRAVDETAGAAREVGRNE